MSNKAEIHYYDGKLHTVVCDSCGDLREVGFILFKHYQNPRKVKKLISLGDLAWVHPKVDPDTEEHSFSNPEEGVTVSYSRDRWGNEPNTRVQPLNYTVTDELLMSVLKESNEDYGYVYIEGLRSWYYIDTVKGGISLLSHALGVKEPKHSKAKRPNSTITKEYAKKVVKYLKLNKNNVYVVNKKFNGDLQEETFSSGEDARRVEGLKFNWKWYESYLKRKPTQAEFVEYIYQQVNDWGK